MEKLKITEMNRLTVDEYRKSEKMPVIVILDHVRSLYNVGSVFRTSDAFRVQRICLCGITARPPHPEIHKTALGAEESVDWKYFERTEDSIKYVRQLGYKVLAIEQCKGSTLLNSSFFSELSNEHEHESQGSKIAIVLGNEVKGVQQSVIDMCDGCLEIPQFGTKHSMNVSVTAGIVLWEFAKALLLPPADTPVR